MSSLPANEPPLLRNLNPEQLAAVTLPAKPALILAGAGSGKTRVLTTRIAWLLSTGQVSPGGVMAVTFTNKAAKEMLARLSAMLPYNVRGMWIGTFHGLCNRLLRAHHQAAKLSSTFQILDTQDQLSAVKRLCKQFNVDDERFPPKQLQYFIAGCKEEGMRPGDVVANDPDTRKKVEIYQLYEEQCQRESVVDFALALLLVELVDLDLLARVRDLPALRGAVPARERGRFRRADAALLRAAARRCRAARPLPAALSPHHGRRVPGHQQAAVPVAQAAGGRHGGWPPAGHGQRDRRGRRRPEHLRLSRCARGQHAGLRARVRRAPADQAGAELPLLQQHPGLRQRAHQPQQPAPGQEPAHHPGPGRARAHLRGAHGHGRGAVDGRDRKSVV